jgi:hypothetical protein
MPSVAKMFALLEKIAQDLILLDIDELIRGQTAQIRRLQNS